MSSPASFAWKANSGSMAKRRPLVAAWIRRYPIFFA